MVVYKPIAVNKRNIRIDGVKDMAYKKLGRPIKGTARRAPITVHAPLDTVDAIDNYILDHEDELPDSYSRSDFYNDAAIALLKQRGVNLDTKGTNMVPENNEKD